MRKPTFLSLLWIVLTVGPSTFAQAPVSGSVACIQSLCGTANPVAHPFEGHKDLEDSSTALVNQQLGKPVQNFMGRIIHEALVHDHLFQQMIEQKEKISIAPNVKAMLLSFKYLNRSNDFGPAFDESTGRLLLNRTKLKEIMPQLSEDEVNAIDSLRTVIEAYGAYAQMFDSPLEVILKGFNNQQSISDTQKQMAQKIFETDQILQKAAPKIKTAPNIVLTKAAAGTALSENEKTIFKQYLFKSIVFSYLWMPTVQSAFAKLPLDISASVDEFKKLYDQSKTYQAVHNPQSIKQIFQKSVSQCSERLTYAYGALPTQAQESSFKVSFENIRATAQKMMEEKTKSSLASAFQIELVLPETQENFLPDMKNSLVESTASYDEALRDLEKLDTQDPEVLSSVFVQALTFSDSELLGEALQFCDQAQPPMLNDAALAQLKMVNLSWPTIRYPEVGVGIIAHELGHVASANWSNYLGVEKNCLTQKQNGNQYLEEDFADLFSTEVTRRLNYVNNGTALKNFACALQPRDEKGLLLEGELKNSDPDDTHSADFYRLMVVASKSNTLTNQCRDELQSHNEARFQNYCNWQP